MTFWESIFGKKGGDAAPEQSSSGHLSGGPKIDAELVIEDDGFRIKNTAAGALKTGDQLLVLYNTDGKNWKKQNIQFQDEPDGMKVFTGERPEEVIVLPLDQMKSALNASEVSRLAYRNRSQRGVGERDWEDGFDSDDFFELLIILDVFDFEYDGFESLHGHFDEYYEDPVGDLGAEAIETGTDFGDQGTVAEDAPVFASDFDPDATEEPETETDAAEDEPVDSFGGADSVDPEPAGVSDSGPEPGAY